VLADPRGGFFFANGLIEKVRRVGGPPLPPNRPPVANAGPDQDVFGSASGLVVQLDGSASADPDGDPLSFNWTASGFSTMTDPSPFVLLAPGIHTFTLTVTDSHGATATDTVTITVTPAADLLIGVSAAPAVVETDGVLTYAVGVRNNGPAVVTNVVLTLPLPASVSFEGTTLPGGCTGPLRGEAGTVWCAVGQLAANAQVAFDVRVSPRLPFSGTLQSTFYVIGDQAELDPSTNLAVVDATVQLVIRIDETIRVTDTVGGSDIDLTETIRVADTIADTFPPTVTPPASITISATEPGGARGNILLSASSRTLAEFLAGGTATDESGAPAVRLTPTAFVGGAFVDVTESTLFVAGATTEVSFRFQDAAGNIGMAVAAVTVGSAIGGSVVAAAVPVQATTSTGDATPFTASLADVTQPGLLLADPLSSPPALPAGFEAVTSIHDITTTALYTGPVTVCAQAPVIAAGDELLHFEASWANVTTTSTSGQVCGQVTSLSPFVVARLKNRAPSANAGSYPPFEATSAGGSAVTLAGSGFDPDSGDTLSFRWSEHATTLGFLAELTVTFPLGDHDLVLTVTDSHGASASATTRVTVRDTTPPAVRPPLSIAVPATEYGGARAAAWPALAAFLDGGSALDLADPSPVRLAPAVSGTPAGLDTLFPVGVTTVVFSHRDASANTGVATATVTVTVGTPRIAVRQVGAGSLGGRLRFVDLAFTNSGTGVARRVTTLVALTTVKGTGKATLVPQDNTVSGGDLNPGDARVVRLTIDVPPTVKELLLVESGVYFNVRGLPGVFTASQRLRPWD
jgi:uncharacterized repeat protein (TIGR01451 family)